MADIYADPLNVQVPAKGGLANFRLKNPMKKQYLYHVELTDSKIYNLSIPPYNEIKMGQNIVIGLTRDPSAELTPAKVKFTIFERPDSFPDFEPSQLGAPIKTFEVIVTPK